LRHSVYKCLEQTAVCNMWHTFTFTLSFDSSLYFIYFHFTSPAWVNVCQASTSCWMTAWYRTDINYYSFSTWQVSQYSATKAASTVSSPPSFSFPSLIFFRFSTVFHVPHTPLFLLPCYGVSKGLSYLTALLSYLWGQAQPPTILSQKWDFFTTMSVTEIGLFAVCVCVCVGVWS